MYLIKLSNNVFYTRISTPAILQTSLGYPREIRLSLFTKYRRLATKRNAQLASAIHTLHEQALAENIPYTDFKIIPIWKINWSGQSTLLCTFC